MVDIVRNEKNWDAEFENVTYKQAQEISKNENIKEVCMYRKLGMSSIYLYDDFTTNLKVRAYDENALKNEKIILKKGRLPTKSNEILISTMTKNTTMIEEKIDLNQELELNINGKTQEYTVVGMAENLDFDETMGLSLGLNIGAIICLDDTLLDEDTILNVSVLTNNIQKIYETIETITDSLGWEVKKENASIATNQNTIKNLTKEEEQALLDNMFIQDTKLDSEDIDTSLKVLYNTKLLNYSCIMENNSEFAKTLIKVGICVVILIMIVSTLVIYTVFKMTYSERVKEFGSLSSLGMDKNGLKEMIRKEAFILSTSGIVIGMWLGFLLSNVIIKILNILISKTIDSKYLFILIDNKITMTLHFPFIMILFAIILVYLIVFIACKFSMRKAVKRNIIENIKSITDIKCNSKQLKYPKIIGKVFKEEGIIGYKNIKRDKIGYKTIVISIIISIVLFVSVSGYISNIYVNEKSKQKYDEYMMSIPVFSLINANALENVLNYIEQNNLVNDYYIVDVALSSAKLILTESEMSDTINQMIKDQVIKENSFSLHPLKLSDNIYYSLLDKAGSSSLKDDEIIILNTLDTKTRYGEKIQITNFNVGDSINAKFENGANKKLKIVRSVR
ncbi:MAG: ABC transporter permease [Clostridia bacterium]|nr:ABC transporter permease [Clostridia bacterium]